MVFLGFYVFHWIFYCCCIHSPSYTCVVFQVSSALCFGKGARGGGEEKEEPGTVPKRDDGRGLLMGRDLFLEEEPIILEVNGQEVKGWKHVLSNFVGVKKLEFPIAVDTSVATAQTSLSTFLREHLNLRGTKVLLNISTELSFHESKLKHCATCLGLSHR